jgi:hypothetical protein
MFCRLRYRLTLRPLREILLLRGLGRRHNQTIPASLAHAPTRALRSHSRSWNLLKLPKLLTIFD